jgi:hypothetical protein
MSSMVAPAKTLPSKMAIVAMRSSSRRDNLQLVSRTDKFW